MYTLSSWSRVWQKKLDPVFRDIDSNVVEENSEKRLGQKCDIDIIHPDFFLTFDETGCNTNMKEDGKVHGEKFVVT